MNPEQLNSLWNEYQGAKQQPDVNALWNEYQASKPAATPEATPQGYQAEIGRTMLDQGLQGATFGFGDEASDAIGANLATLYGLGQKGLGAITGDQAMESAGQDLLDTDLYDIGRQQSKERLAAQMQQRPALSIGSQLAGALLTGGAGASTKAGSAVANSLRTGSTALRVGKGAAAGATSGAAYGFGAGQGNGQNRLESAGENALLGAALGGAIPAVGAAVKSAGKEASYAFKGLKAGDAESLKKVGGTIKESSSNAYKEMRSIGATLKNQTVGNLLNKVNSDLLKTGKLNARLHGDTLSVLDDLNAAAKKGDLGLEELDQFRQLLSDAARKNTSKIDGANPDALKARKAIDSIDEVIEGLKPNQLSKGGKQAVAALDNARSEWSRYKKYDRIATIFDKSEGDGNYIKRELKKLSDDKRNGFNLKEKQILKEASKLSVTEGILKSLGKFGFDLGNSRLGNTALPVIGGYFSGGVALPVAGTVAREGQKLIAKGKVADLLKVIEQGGNVSAQQLSQLPPNQAMQVLNKLRSPKGKRLAISIDPTQAEYNQYRSGQ